MPDPPLAGAASLGTIQVLRNAVGVEPRRVSDFPEKALLRYTVQRY